MSELKDRWFLAYPTESVDCDGITGSAHEVYSKSDVDSVIAKKDKEIQRLEERIADGDKDFEMATSQNERLLKIVLHNKYKRCLATANWCAAECVVNQNTYKKYFTHKSEFRIEHFRKWYFRLLKLAEKFEEVK